MSKNRAGEKYEFNKHQSDKDNNPFNFKDSSTYFNEDESRQRNRF